MNEFIGSMIWTGEKEAQWIVFVQVIKWVRNDFHYELLVRWAVFDFAVVLSVFQPISN